MVAGGVGGEGQWPEVAGSGGWWQKTATMGGGRGLPRGRGKRWGNESFDNFGLFYLDENEPNLLGYAYV